MKTVGELITELQKYPGDMGLVIFLGKWYKFGKAGYTNNIRYSSINRLEEVEVLSDGDNSKLCDINYIDYSTIKEKKADIIKVLALHTLANIKECKYRDED